VEVERVQREYPDVNVRWSPYLLNPAIPAEGQHREPQTTADTPKSHLELMGEARDITFSRGRTFTPNSHYALQTSEFAYDHGQHSEQFHRAVFKANFTDFENIGEIDVLARIASEHEMDGEQLRQALTNGDYREKVDEQIEWARQVGVTGVPTFIFDYKYAIVGAQEYEAFERVLGTIAAEKNGEGDDAAATRAQQQASPETTDQPPTADTPPKDPDWAI
jgi:predicted DsbA family dithiol-disulfide isomerase